MRVDETVATQEDGEHERRVHEVLRIVFIPVSVRDCLQQSPRICKEHAAGLHRVLEVALF
jgi:hypothetical protein